mmetsp:Transcript_11712/g.41017  ORF Transcript_11712/g.41017 Transcript_11712/m.41017 type:complete len:396 (+) Transcript_11712:244-1431(+)
MYSATRALRAWMRSRGVLTPMETLISSHGDSDRRWFSISSPASCSLGTKKRLPCSVSNSVLSTWQRLTTTVSRRLLSTTRSPTSNGATSVTKSRPLMMDRTEPPTVNDTTSSTVDTGSATSSTDMRKATASTMRPPRHHTMVARMAMLADTSLKSMKLWRSALTLSASCCTVHVNRFLVTVPWSLAPNSSMAASTRSSGSFARKASTVSASDRAENRSRREKRCDTARCAVTRLATFIAVAAECAARPSSGFLPPLRARGSVKILRPAPRSMRSFSARVALTCFDTSSSADRSSGALSSARMRRTRTKRSRRSPRRAMRKRADTTRRPIWTIMPHKNMPAMASNVRSTHHTHSSPSCASHSPGVGYSSAHTTVRHCVRPTTPKTKDAALPAAPVR